MSLAKILDPATLHRSPMLMKFVSGLIRIGSRPASIIVSPFSPIRLGLGFTS